MSVNKALDSILANRLDEMRTNFSSALTTKAVEKLEERKIEIAQAYFGQMQEEVEELDEKTIASKKAEKGTKYKVQSKDSDNDSDNEGSSITLRQGKRVKDIGDYDRGARAFFMKKGTYGSAKDILNTVKEENSSENLLKLDAIRKDAARKANNRNTPKYRQKQMRHQDDRIMRAGRVIASKAKSYEE